MSEANELDELLAGVEAPDGLIAEDVLESLSASEDGLAALDDDDEGDKGTGAPTIDKSAIYEEQTSTLGVASEEEAAPKKGKRAKKKGGAAAAPKAPKVTKSKTAPKADGSENAVILTRSAALSKKAQVEDLTKIGVKAADIPALLEGMDGAPKKVSEKAYNFLRYSLGREHLSNYTRFALEQLAAAGPAGMTVPQMVKAMEDRGWKPGTARSQSQQMSRLFGIFGMVDKAGSKMVLTPKAPLVKASLDRLSVAFVTSV